MQRGCSGDALLLIPDLCLLECASVLLKQVHRQLLSLDECRALLADLLQLPIRPTSASELAVAALALGVAIAQACYATTENHERSVLHKLLGEPDLEGVLIQADALRTQQAFFGCSQSRGPTSS